MHLREKTIPALFVMLFLSTGCEKITETFQGMKKNQDNNPVIADSASSDLPEITAEEETQLTETNPGSSPEPLPSGTPEIITQNTVSPSAEPEKASRPEKSLLHGEVADLKGQPIRMALLTFEPGFKQVWTYDQGKFSAPDLKPGKYTLTVDKEKFVSRHLNIEVKSTKTDSLKINMYPELKEIRLASDNPEVLVGVPFNLDAIALFQDESSSRQLKWQIEDSSIAQISQDSIVTGLKAGSSKVRVATQESKIWQKEFEIKVNRFIVSLEGPGKLNQGSRSSIFAEPPADSRFKDAVYTWKSSNQDVLTIKPHPAAPNIALIEGLRAGESEIQATLKLKNENVDIQSRTLKIYVEEK